MFAAIAAVTEVQIGVDAVFVPEAPEVYPPEFAAKISMGPITVKMCGAFRPGHFDGVCTVVMKLLGIKALMVSNAAVLRGGDKGWF